MFSCCIFANLLRAAAQGKKKVDRGSDVRAEKIFVVRGGDEGAA